MNCFRSLYGLSLHEFLDSYTEPSMIWASNVDGSAVLYRTIHDIDLRRGRFASGY